MNQIAENWQSAIDVAEPAFAEIAATNKLLRVQEEIEFARQAFMKNDYLQKCYPMSVRDAVVNVASVGLSLNPALGLAYLVPRKLKSSDSNPICCLDVSYKGLIKLATDTGAILWAKAELVRQGDEYEWCGVASAPIHRVKEPFNDEARGPVVGGYCVAKTADGDYLTEQMSMKELSDVEAVSKVGDGFSPWKGVFGNEMRKKTLIKRASKTWPKSNPRMAHAIHVINEHEGIVVNDGDGDSSSDLVEIASGDVLKQITDGMAITGSIEANMLAFLNQTYDASYTDLAHVTAKHAEVLLHNLNKKADQQAAKETAA